MIKHVSTSSVAACGLITSLATAILVTVVQRVTGLELFAYFVWFVIPIGALGIGFVAASGYYFGSLFFNVRPTFLLLIQMMVIAGATQFLIYYLDYATFTLADGTRVSDFIPFSKYLSIVLTSAHYGIGDRGQFDVGAVGKLGYGLAAIQFLGFLAGGLCAFGFLLSRPFCDKCKKYFKSLSKSDKTFDDAPSMAAYHDALFALPFDSPKFAELIAENHSAKTVQGTARLAMRLFGCPHCKAQIIVSKVSVWNGNDWKDFDELERKHPVPPGIDMTGVYAHSS